MLRIGLLSLLCLTTTLGSAAGSSAGGDGVTTHTFQLENGIKVLIETDANLDRSAAALSVNVGSMDNDGVEGLAHLLEHMLFLGTGKYPDPADYKDYLAQNDGSSNAYTAEDETNYHFEVRNEAFEGALDRFSRFFIDPLMTDALSTRELNAVDSEHSKNLENEFWRTRQVWRSLLNPEHPHCGFSTGNSTTLAGVKNAKLREFYEAKYSANLMNLVVVSPYPAEQVEKWIREKFSEVPNRNLKPLTVDLPLQGEGLRGKLVEVKSLTDVHQLWMRFELPESSFDWRSKPGNILGGVIGHEGRESLLQDLKQRGLATSLSAGPQRIAKQGYFNLTLTLTPDGMTNLDMVLERTFGFLNHLRSLPEIPPYLIKERQSMSEIGFRFRERDAAMAEARMRASMMHSYPYENLLPSIYLMPEPNPESVSEVLQYLTPENVMVLVYSKDRETDQVEKHYQTQYRVTPLGAERLARFKAATPSEGVEAPATNPFIPSDFALVETTHAENVWKYDASYGDVWLRHDLLFGQPKVSFEATLYNDKNSASAKDFVLGNLYASAVQLAMNPYSYPLNEAGVAMGISSERKGITLAASGFSEKMPALAEFVVPFMKELRITEAQFGVIKQQYAMGLANFPQSSPLDQAFERFREVIREYHFTPDQQAQALAPLTFGDLQDYFGRVHENVRLRSFVYGNMTEEGVRQTMDTLMAGIAPKNIITEADRYNGRVLKFGKGQGTILTRSVDAQDSAALMLVQGDVGGREQRAALDILAKIFPPQFYGDLRTLQQTGYIVQAFAQEVEGLPFLFAFSQSSVVSTDSLRGRFVANIAHFLNDLDDLSEEEFQANKASAIAKLSQKSTSFGAELARNFALIDIRDEDFADREKQIIAVEALTRDRWIGLTRKFLGADARTVSIQMDGRKERHRYKTRNIEELRKAAEGWHERATSGL
ncbi:MAG: hypothetical protein GY930_15500 [bacterium]|nr:hypothetical protein [bacterium]